MMEVLTQLMVMVLVTMLMVTEVVSSTKLSDVLHIFRDRLEVARCRAGCDARLHGEQRGQCWTVCHMLAADPHTWARVCSLGRHHGVCDQTCLTACRLYTEGDLNLSTNSSLTMSLSDGRVTLHNKPAHSVMLLTGRDEAGDWYELGQSTDHHMDTVDTMVETFVICVTVSGDVTIARMEDSNTQDISEHWELFLDKIDREQNIFHVSVYWLSSEGGQQFAVRWTIDGNIAGVVLTNDTSVTVSAPALAQVTLQVTDIVTGDLSDSLTITTPDIPDNSLQSSDNAGLIISLIIMFTLVIILAIVIIIFRRTKPSCTSSNNSLISTGQDKSIISFDTFVKKNQILVPPPNNTLSSLSVNVDLYVL